MHGTGIIYLNKWDHLISVYFPNMKRTNRIVYNKIHSGINKTQDEWDITINEHGINEDGRGADN